MILRPPRVADNSAAGRRGLPVIIGAIPVRAPLPNITGHVEKAVPVGWKLTGSRAGIAVLAGVLIREMALEGIGLILAAGPELAAPRVWLAIQPAARGELPLGLSRKALAGPLAYAAASSQAT